jgi:hypothetical protein
MAMDVQTSVYGQVPDENWDDAAPGHFFRTSRWWWRPLTNYICLIAPTLARHCTTWWSTEGQGLNQEQALALANQLHEEHASGRLAQYAREYKQRQNSLPLQTCPACDGSGKRLTSVRSGTGAQECDGCRGTGSIKNRECNYHFTEENVLRFAKFLEHCEGFEFD